MNNEMYLDKDIIFELGWEVEKDFMLQEINSRESDQEEDVKYPWGFLREFGML